MAFKTAAEMFGDGGGFGPAVPYSTANPPGTSAGNRGIQFGEQLTAAIANRTHYALALNDDDLNTRIATFETDGLDAAYRGGALATPGSGRVILKDGDAVETVSAHGALSADTVHFRSNSLSDSASVSVGFEFVGKRSAGDGQSGNDPIAGFLDRRVFASATGNTQLKHNEPAILNPTAVLPTTVRIPGGQFHVGGTTDLVRNYDLVQISGSASSDGLYIFSNIGLATTDAVLERIDGTTPAFPVAEACTISVYRVRLGSFGSFTSRGRLYSASVVGTPQALSAVDIVAGANNTTNLSGGSLSALRIMRKALNGSTFAAADFDLFGRATWSIPRSSIPTEYDKNVYGGGYATRVLAQEPGMAGHQVEGEAAVTDRFDFTSLQEIDLTAYGVAPFAAALNFTANSPLNGEVLFSVAPSFEFDHLVPGVGGLVSILNTAGAAADGLYWIHSTIISGTKGFYLRCLDGSVPAHFPAFGAFTVGRIYAGSVVGRRIMIDNPNPVEAGDINKPVLASVLTGTDEVGATALGLVATRDPVGVGERSLIRGFRPAPAAADNYQEVFKVGSNGNVHTIGNITSAPPGSVTTYARVNNSSFSAIAPGFSASYGAGSVGIANTATSASLSATPAQVMVNDGSVNTGAVYADRVEVTDSTDTLSAYADHIELNGPGTPYLEIYRNQISVQDGPLSASVDATTVAVAGLAATSTVYSNRVEVVSGLNTSAVYSDRVESNDFKYTAALAKSIIVPLTDGVCDPGDWLYNADSVTNVARWTAQATGAPIFFPLRVPNDCQITNLRLVVDPTFAPGMPGNLTAELLSVDHFITGPTAVPAVIGQAQINASTAGLQPMNFGPALPPTPPSTQLIHGPNGAATREFLLKVTSNVAGVGDIIHSIQLQLSLNKPAPL